VNDDRRGKEGKMVRSNCHDAHGEEECNLKATPDTMSGNEFRQMAELHCRCLSDSMVTRLGRRYAASFYRYVERSEKEFAFVQRAGDAIVGVCVVSEDPDSLRTRLARHTTLIPWLCLRCYRLPLGAILKSSLPWTGKPQPPNRPGTSIPELLLIFTAPEVRGRGLGASLLARCEAFLASRDRFRYRIKTIDDDANPALAFYTRHGFAMRGCIVELGRRFQIWEKSLPVRS